MPLNFLGQLRQQGAVARGQPQRHGGAAAGDLDVDRSPRASHAGAVRALRRPDDDARQRRGGHAHGSLGLADNELVRHSTATATSRWPDSSRNDVE